MSSFDPDKLDQLAKDLKALAKAQRDSLRAADATRAFHDAGGMRRGPRGGRATTLQARWQAAAEYRDRLGEMAARDAIAVLGIRSGDFSEGGEL